MNILKLKSIFFSLMAIAMVTVFLTSCEKDRVKAIETETQINETSKLILPFGVNENSDLAISYLNNATEAEINIWESNAKISESLSFIGKLNEIKSTLKIGENISDVEFEEMLSKEEINLMNQGKIEIESRGCTTVFSFGCLKRKKCCKPPHGDCYYYWTYGC